PAAPRGPPARWLVWAGAALVVAAGLAAADYARVAVIFSARPGLPPLEQRIAEGRRSVLFGHHADYAAVTSGVAVPDEARAFDRATHYLLDTRLMMAWSRALAEQGRLDEARHLAARLREFRKPEAEAFFSVCEGADGVAEAGASAPPFQCGLPERNLSWRKVLAAGDR
ncbi:O-antigen polymerase, partial [sediment metagenome]